MQTKTIFQNSRIDGVVLIEELEFKQHGYYQQKTTIVELL